jgi:hypothetical protein
MIKFADFKGTPFVPYLLPIIPKGSALAPESKLTPDKLGKIPGRYNIETNTWSGIPWDRATYNRDGTLDVYDRWFELGGRPCSTIALQGTELVAVDQDSEDAASPRLPRTLRPASSGPMRRSVFALVRINSCSATAGSPRRRSLPSGV